MLFGGETEEWRGFGHETAVLWDIYVSVEVYRGSWEHSNAFSWTVRLRFTIYVGVC